MRCPQSDKSGRKQLAADGQAGTGSDSLTALSLSLLTGPACCERSTHTGVRGHRTEEQSPCACGTCTVRDRSDIGGQIAERSDGSPCG